ncbi:MAG: TrmH family RNA methyltransferase [Bacteroidota bacterium]
MPQNIHKIKDLENKDLHPYKTLRRPLEHLKSGIFVAEGEKVVKKLLSSQLQLVSLLVTPDWFSKLESDLSLLKDEIKIFIADKTLLETIVGCNLHQGIMAIARVPANRTLNEIIRSLAKPAMFVALDGLVSAENVGVIVRNCAGFGVDAIIVGETSSSPYLRRAVRNSMGTVFDIPIVHVDNLQSTLNDLRTIYNCNVAAAHPAGAQSIYDADFSGNVCIVLGNEGDGLSQKILDACSTYVSIPMNNKVDSLNVGSASAVLLYESSRQRKQSH